MFKPKFLRSLIVAAAITPAMAFAGSPEFYLTAPFYAFDNDIGVKDAIGVSLSAGYRLDNPFGFEVTYAKSSTEVDGLDNADVDVESISANALYHFAESEKISPYVLLGVAQNTFQEDGAEDQDDLSLDVGLGLKGHVTDMFEVRTELRNAHTQEDGHNIASLSLGVGLRFGAEKPAPAPAPAPAPVAPLDSDKDGVTDDLDKCPGTAPKLKVDEVGCPVILKEAVSISLNVLFDTASDVVKPEYEAEIKKAADFLEQYEGTSVVIEGHTDTRGSNAYNKTLSQKRADSVASVLVSKYGIAASRVHAKGFGEEQPLIAKDTKAEDQAKNRRVIAKVSAEKQTQVTK